MANNAVLAAEFQRQQIADSVQVAAKRVRDATEAEATITRERTRRNVFLFVGLGLALFAAVVIAQRNRIRKEHGRSEELLLNILPQEVAQELKQKGEADARSIEEVTILFTDFKGFTAISEQLSARDLVDELNACFKAFDHIITSRGIEKIKTIGDAYMCAGGLHGQDRTTPVHVVMAALEMQDFMRERKTVRQAAGLPAFEMRVGIHTGSVVAGIVGVKKFQYDIWGDTVNIASRMESSGEVGQVNISYSTARLLRGTSGLRSIPRGPVEVKGKGAMEMWFVERA